MSSFISVITPIVIAVALGGALSGCSRASTGAEANGREAPAKAVQTETVRREDVKRTVNVSGTLAAENEVTVSSQAEGVVSRILADLGDRVSAGQVLVELDREKLQYNLDQQKAALARSLARYGATEPGQLPPDRTDARREAGGGRARTRPDRAFDRASELNKRQLVPQQALDDADAALRAKQAELRPRRCRTRGTWRPTSTPSNAAAQLADRQLRDASIRAPFDGYVQQRLVSLGELVKEPDAGDEHRARRSPEGHRRDPGRTGALGAGRPAGRSAGRRVSGPAPSPERCRASARP